MRPPDEVRRELVRRWVAKAEEDRAVIKKLPYDEPQCRPPIAYHAQQIAEKLVKAFLVHHEVEFQWTHDIDELLDLVAQIDGALAESLRPAAKLTVYASETRYPTNAPALTVEDAKRAVTLAESVRSAILRALQLD